MTRLVGKQKQDIYEVINRVAVFVAQLREQLLPNPEACSSNPVISKILHICLPWRRKQRIRVREREWQNISNLSRRNSKKYLIIFSVNQTSSLVAKTLIRVTT